MEICDGRGRYPILDLIGEYSDNTYVLYVVFGKDVGILNKQKSFTNSELVSKVENDDFENISEDQEKKLKILVMKFQNIVALENLLKRYSEMVLTANDAYYACYCGLDVLQFLESKNPPILQTVNGANWACLGGHLDILQFLESRNPPILPDVEGANNACLNGHLDVLRYLESKNPPILPDVNGANWACMGGHLDVLQFLKSRNPPILLNEKGANMARINGHLDVLQFLELNPEDNN
jgi:hypothetical protein